MLVGYQKLGLSQMAQDLQPRMNHLHRMVQASKNLRLSVSRCQSLRILRIRIPAVGTQLSLLSWVWEKPKPILGIARAVQCRLCLCPLPISNPQWPLHPSLKHPTLAPIQLFLTTLCKRCLMHLRRTLEQPPIPVRQLVERTRLGTLTGISGTRFSANTWPLMIL